MKTTHDDYIARYSQPYTEPKPTPPNTHDAVVAHLTQEWKPESTITPTSPVSPDPRREAVRRSSR